MAAAAGTRDVAKRFDKRTRSKPSSNGVSSRPSNCLILEMSGCLRVMSPSGSGGRWTMRDSERVLCTINRATSRIVDIASLPTL